MSENNMPRTLEEWTAFARRDDCLDLMVPSDLRAIISTQAKMLGALKAMVLHSCVADAAPEDKFEEDHLAERLAYAAIAKAEGQA